VQTIRMQELGCRVSGFWFWVKGSTLTSGSPRRAVAGRGFEIHGGELATGLQGTLVSFRVEDFGSIIQIFSVYRGGFFHADI
jgi:hypothetical protein